MTHRGGCQLSLEEFVGLFSVACKLLSKKKKFQQKNPIDVSLSLLTPSELGLQNSNATQSSLNIENSPSKLYLILTWYQHSGVNALYFPLPLIEKIVKSANYENFYTTKSKNNDLRYKKKLDTKYKVPSKSIEDEFEKLKKRVDDLRAALGLNVNSVFKTRKNDKKNSFSSLLDTDSDSHSNLSHSKSNNCSLLKSQIQKQFERLSLYRSKPIFFEGPNSNLKSKPVHYRRSISHDKYKSSPLDMKLSRCNSLNTIHNKINKKNLSLTAAASSCSSISQFNHNLASSSILPSRSAIEDKSHKQRKNNYSPRCSLDRLSLYSARQSATSSSHKQRQSYQTFSNGVKKNYGRLSQCSNASTYRSNYHTPRQHNQRSNSNEYSFCRNRHSADRPKTYKASNQPTYRSLECSFDRLTGNFATNLNSPLSQKSTLHFSSNHKINKSPLHLSIYENKVKSKSLFRYKDEDTEELLERIKLLNISSRKSASNSPISKTYSIDNSPVRCPVLNYSDDQDVNSDTYDIISERLNTLKSLLTASFR